MGRLTQELAKWDGTHRAAAAVERAAYSLSRELFAGRLYDVLSQEADDACRQYQEAVARATSTSGGEILTIIAWDPDRDGSNAMCVEVVDTDANGEQFTRLTITPDDD